MEWRINEVSKRFVDKMVEVKRMSEPLLMVKLMVGKRWTNVISCYAPPNGRTQVEKDELWNTVYDVVSKLKNEKMVVLGRDLNGHVGQRSEGH